MNQRRSAEISTKKRTAKDYLTVRLAKKGPTAQVAHGRLAYPLGTARRHALNDRRKFSHLLARFVDALEEVGLEAAQGVEGAGAVGELAVLGGGLDAAD